MEAGAALPCADITERGTILIPNNASNASEMPVHFSHFWACTVEAHIHAQLKTFAPPIMIVVGTVGNLLSFYLLTRRGLNQFSVCYYLAMYSLTNILVLYIGCGMDWFSHVTETTYIANFSDWLCRVWQFMYKVIIYAAGWIVVSMVIDRFIILWHPRQAPYMCTVFMAKLVMIIIVIGLVVVSVHAMWTYELNAQGCSVDPMQQDFQTLAWPWISAALCSYIPLVLIFLFSIVITIGLVCPRADAVSVTNMNQSTQDQLTKLTLVVGFVFLTLNLPTIIVNIIEYSNRAVGYALWAKFLLARVIGQTISCLNCAASFFLYFAFVPQMRKDFMELVKRMKKSNTSSIEEMQTIEVNSNREKYLTKSEQDTTSATQV